MIKLEENEKIVKILRKHWFSIVLDLFPVVILVIIPPIFYKLFHGIVFSDLSNANFFLLLFGYIIFLIIIWLLAFSLWINYYLDMWIITNKRIVDVEQRTLFFRDMASLRLDKIQDIKIEVSGLINTLLKIGNLYVQTASSRKDFVIRQAANPELAKQIIMDVQDQNDERAKIVKIKEEDGALL